MFELLGLEQSTIAGGVVVVFVLAFLRFGNAIVDFLLSYMSSPVEAMEQSMPERE